MARVLFCDIETTGLDPNKDKILEVYGRVFNLDTLEAGEEFYWLTSDLPDLSTVDPYVRDMHHKNGLWQAILENPQRTLFWMTFEDFLGCSMSEEYEEKKIVLAGRSVQFDLSFLRNFTARFHHRVFDLRSIIGFWTSNTDDKDIEKRFMTSKELAEHRAKQDVINDILLYQDIAYKMRSEAKYYKDW